MSSQTAPRALGPSWRCHLQRAALLLLCACAPIACATPTREQVRLEAYSWWTRSSEQKAFDRVLGIYNAAHHDSQAINQVTEDVNADEVRATLTARLLAGAPPSTFQANAGADLLRWTAMDTTEAALPSASRIAPLDAFLRTGLTEALPRELYKALQAGPQRLPYAVPLNIHRLNLVYYNTSALDDYARRHAGRSFLDAELLCPKDVALRLENPDEKLELRIAVGARDSFTLSLFVLENVLPAVAGSAAYNELTGGTLYDEFFLGTLPESKWHEPLLRALQCVQYLSRSFLPESSDQSWADALNQVEAGNADFSVMGDWSNGELKQGLEEGRVDARPFPGSEGTFVFTSDTFPLPVLAPYAEQSQDLLETLASAEAQLAFSAEKGSIPARADISTAQVETALGPRAAETRRAFESPEIHKSIATSGLFPPYFPAELSARLAEMTAPGASKASIDAVIALLRNALPLLERWQSRIAKGQQTP